MPNSPRFFMKSTKPVKNLDEILLPLIITPDENIEGGVNGRMFFFSAGKPSALTYSEYEALTQTPYAKYIKPKKGYKQWIKN